MILTLAPKKRLPRTHRGLPVRLPPRGGQGPDHRDRRRPALNAHGWRSEVEVGGTPRVFKTSIGGSGRTPWGFAPLKEHAQVETSHDSEIREPCFEMLRFECMRTDGTVGTLMETRSAELDRFICEIADCQTSRPR